MPKFMSNQLANVKRPGAAGAEEGAGFGAMPLSASARGKIPTAGAGKSGAETQLGKASAYAKSMSYDAPPKLHMRDKHDERD